MFYIAESLTCIPKTAALNSEIHPCVRRFHNSAPSVEHQLRCNCEFDMHKFQHLDSFHHIIVPTTVSVPCTVHPIRRKKYRERSLILRPGVGHPSLKSQ